jgi:hypothetical protein
MCCFFFNLFFCAVSLKGRVSRSNHAQSELHMTEELSSLYFFTCSIQLRNKKGGFGFYKLGSSKVQPRKCTDGSQSLATCWRNALSSFNVKHWTAETCCMSNLQSFLSVQCAYLTQSEEQGSAMPYSWIQHHESTALFKAGEKKIVESSSSLCKNMQSTQQFFYTKTLIIV